VLDPDDVAAIAMLAYAEMLESGFTRVGEFHYLHHDIDGRPYANPAAMAESIAHAATSTGIALTLLPSFYAHGGFGGQPPNDGQRRFICNLDSFAQLLDGCRHAIAGMTAANLGIAPHSLRAVTPEELGELRTLADTGPIHIHAAEQTKEVEDCLAWSGKRPVEWLLETQSVDQNWCLIHATHMTRDETRNLAASGATAGLCPITEADLGDGIFNGDAFLSANGSFGVGTDSNVMISAAGELRQLEYAQRLGLRLRNVMVSKEGSSTGRSLFDRTLSGGARALGQKFHGLAPGAAADLVTLSADDPALCHRDADALLDGWIFTDGDRAVDTVWCLGRKVVENGRHVQREAIQKSFAATIAKVLGS